MTTLILGSNGFLGGRLSKSHEFALKTTLFCFRKGNIFFVKNLEGSLKYKSANRNPIEEIVHKFRPKVILNCIALADVKICEINTDLAFQINAILPKILVNLSLDYNFKLVHFSTDAVYGQKGKFFLESEIPKPISVYGMSKLSGENEILSRSNSALILRIRPFGHDTRWRNLFDFFYRSLSQNKITNGFTNVFFTPIAISNIAPIVKFLLDFDKNGIFHVAGNQRISKFDFGRTLAQKLQYNENLIMPTNLVTSQDCEEFDTSLNTNKINSIMKYKNLFEHDLDLEILKFLGKIQ